MRKLRLFLDTNILVDAQVRDILCRFSEAGLVDVYWSPEILSELRRTLTSRLGCDIAKVERLIGALERSFPGATTTDYEHRIDQLTLPDPNDRHVLAAAIKSETDFLVTDNVSDFPDDIVDAHDVLVLTGDEALLLVASENRHAVGAIVQRQISALRRPPMTSDQFVKRLGKRAPQGAMAIGIALGLPGYDDSFVEMMDAYSDDSPQGAVQALLSAIEHGTEAELCRLVHADVAMALTGRRAPSATELMARLKQALEDVFEADGWGFGTARRIQAPDTELVKLVRAGDTPRMVFEPQIHQGHLFLMRREGHDWILIELDGPDPALSST